MTTEQKIRDLVKEEIHSEEYGVGTTEPVDINLDHVYLAILVSVLQMKIANPYAVAKMVMNKQYQMIGKWEMLKPFSEQSEDTQKLIDKLISTEELEKNKADISEPKTISAYKKKGN